MTLKQLVDCLVPDQYIRLVIYVMGVHFGVTRKVEDFKESEIAEGEISRISVQEDGLLNVHLKVKEANL